MRPAALLAILIGFPILLSGQSPSALRVTVTLPGEAQKPTPVSRHALLISDNPSTTVPRRVLTGPDGAVAIQLLPGSYTVESDRPVLLAGRSYEWTQMIEVVAGRDATLALTADNAKIASATAASAAAGTDPPSSDPAFLPGKWRDSVMAVWSPTSRATGFLFDALGLIATHGLAAANGTTVAVQVSPELKVPASILFSDRARDIAIVWVHPSVIAGRPSIPLGCPPSPAAALVEGQELTTMTAPFGRPVDLESGEVTGFAPRAVETNLRLRFGGEGGPVFNAAGAIVGLTSLAPEGDRSRSPDVTVVRAGILCDAIAAARLSLSANKPPEPDKLPIEPQGSSVRELENAQGLAAPPVVSSADFDVAFITPAAIQQARQRGDRTGGRSSRSPEAAARLGLLTDFGPWSPYFAETPAVIVVRVTPKLVEGFWKRLAREAARTQGAVLPPFKDFKTSFVRMRASCGSAEVVPIQPFVLEHRVSATRAIREGLYVFDPAAFGPKCSRVTLSLYAENSQEKADTVTIDAALLGGHSQ